MIACLPHKGKILAAITSTQHRPNANADRLSNLPVIANKPDEMRLLMYLKHLNEPITAQMVLSGSY